MTGAVTLLIGGGIALAYVTATGSGTGTGSTIEGFEDITVFGPDAAVNLEPGVPAALYGTFDNPNYAVLGVEKVDVIITGIWDKTTGHYIDPTVCSSEPGVDFVLTPAVGSPVFEVGKRTGEYSWGHGSWSGASIELRPDPDRNQDGCLNVTVKLRYEAVKN